MKRYCTIGSMLVVGLMCLTLDAVAVSNDKILSSHIKDADGTSAQDTNLGSGIKTAHIQDEAITDRKISGVSMSKVAGLQAILDGKADTDHEHDATDYGNITIVATSGGDYADPAHAMAALADWCGVPSESNPCVVSIMPGVYELSAPVRLVPYVELIGSGKGNTLLQANGFNAIEGDSAGVAITAMSIESDLYAVYLDTAAALDGFTIKDVNATSRTRGAVLILNNDSSLTVEGCELIGRDGPLGFRGTHSNNTLEIRIRDSALLTNNTNYLPEAAVFGSNAHRLDLESVEIAGYLENFQVNRIEEIRVNRLDGVAYFNFADGIDVTVRDSRLSNPLGGPVPIVWRASAYGPIKLVNTMLVGGTDASAENVTLLNCFDEDLQTVTTTP